MNKEKIAIIAIVFSLIVVGVVYGISMKSNEKQITKSKSVELYLEYNGQLTSQSKEQVVIPVKLSKLLPAVYPSASISIEFDSQKLEFTGITRGTMENYSKKVPKWDVDVDKSNEIGVINAIYLDKSGAKDSYYKSGFEEGSKDIVLNLKFRLKDDAKSSDKLKLKISDAVFATVNGSEDKSSLSTLKGTMKGKDLTLEVK
ncbi:cohesin domain-containing protein [Intestinibacter sp.]